MNESRTTVTLSTNGDGVVSMHWKFSGTWIETRDDLQACLQSLEEDLVNAQQCPRYPKESV